MQFEKVGVASDHAGKELRKMVLEYLQASGVQTVDYGVDFKHEKSVDYPDYSALLAEGVSKGEFDGAIAICGTGLGMSISANKFPGVRATCVWDEFSCRMSREHNNSNILCLGSRALNFHRAVELVRIWLETSFLGDRHQLRLNKIHEIEKLNFKPR